MDNFSWTDIEDIAIGLYEAYPDDDPLTVRFDRLRDLVEGLEGFAAEPGQSVNEQILEAIQVAWHEEYTDGAPLDRDADDDDDRPGYSPNQPFR